MNFSARLAPRQKAERVQKFFAWMDELNREAARRRYNGWLLQEEIAHNRNCSPRCPERCPERDQRRSALAGNRWWNHNAGLF
jgi:hypothetical protein